MEIMIKYLFRQKLKTILLFALFYTVGVIGIRIPQTQGLFIFLTPFVLLLSFIAIMLFHKSLNGSNTRFVFITIIIVSYLIEVAGVKTHLIFGDYSYGNGLGIKVMGTPLMIGINWVMLVYCSASVLDLFKVPMVLKIILASVLMVLYDLVLEVVAPFLDMWAWAGNSIPLQNYVVWFILALFFHGLLKWKRVKTENPVAPALFVCQFLFFVAILIFVK
jgi:putative membrane protein